MEDWSGHKISGPKSALWLFTCFFDFGLVFLGKPALLASPEGKKRCFWLRQVFLGKPRKNMECFKHSIFRNWSTDFTRMYLYFILRLFDSFFCKFRPMPLILVQQQAPSFIFRSRKFFIFNTHELYRKIRDLHIMKKFY